MMMLIVKTLVFVLLISICYSSDLSGATTNKQHRCIPVTISPCKQLGYNHTRPIDMYSSVSVNMKNGKKYIEQLASIDLPDHLKRFKKCAKDTIFLLCSVYSPICFQGHKDPIPPCKGVCNRLKDKCGSLLNSYGIELPEELECDSLPEHNSAVCIQPSSLLSSQQVKQQSKVKNVSSEVDSKVPKCDCNSQELRKPRYRNFRKAHYVIEAAITSRSTLANGHAKVIVNITNIMKSGKIPLKLGKMRLWSPTSCLCQKVEYDLKYIIMGVENTKRLVIDKDTFILPNKEYASKIRKWKHNCIKHGKCAGNTMSKEMLSKAKQRIQKENLLRFFT